MHRLRRRQRLTRISADTVYLVRSGLVTLEGAPHSGTRTILELLYPGDLVTPALQPFIPDLALTTTTAAELWRMPTESFALELQRSASLTDRIFRRQNAQRARMHVHIAVLAGLASEQRVAGLLIEAACRLGNADDGRITFEMPLSRTEVAEYLAINADTLSRIMSRFTSAGVLERSGRTQMAVAKWDQLVALCPISEMIIALHKQPSAPA